MWPGALGLLVVLDVLWIGALVVDLLLTPSPSGVGVNRESPPAFSAGRAVPVSYRWTAPGHRSAPSDSSATDRVASPPSSRRATIEVREQLPDPLDDGSPVRRIVIPPIGEFVEERTVKPRHRGRADGGTLTIRLLGPLGLAWRQDSSPAEWGSVVYPSLAGESARGLPASARRREAGRRALRRAGEGRLFETLREWVPGDDTRIIDWKATARRGKPIARQYEDERRQQVLLVIDAGRLLTAEIDGRARLESVIDAALQLAHAAVEHDDNVGLMVFADDVQHYIAPARGRRALRQILDALSTVEGRLVEPNYPAAFAYLATRNRKRALTVVFTDVIDRTASDALVSHVGSLRPRHLPLAVALRNPELDRLATSRPPTVGAAFERAAAEELLQARDEALASMRSRGVLILDVAPAGAARAVVDEYTLLKRRAMI